MRSPQRGLPIYRDVPAAVWEDWALHQSVQLRTTVDVRRRFPGASAAVVGQAERWQDAGLRFNLTPYLLSLIVCDDGGVPLPDDPIWRQFYPLPLPERQSTRADEYSPGDENWELPAEMLTPILQHKYPDRAIAYVADSCMAYCGYCLRSLQSTAEVERHGGVKHWAATLAALKAHPEIQEVILSGGEPLVLSNERLGTILNDLREVPSIRAIRIHTRAFTHNPYRLDEGLGTLLRQYAVTEMGLHVAHPNELTVEFDEALDRLRASSPRTLFLGQSVLIKGVNDEAQVLEGLFRGLYERGVKPYYLNHLMPNIPAAGAQRTTVRRGVELMRALKRRVSNPAVPEYIIVHKTGKHTVPLELDGTPEFQYGHSLNGHPAIRFKNWKGDWEMYLDSTDAAAS